MEPSQIQQEILLVTRTSFSASRLLNTDDPDNLSPLREKEQLLEACWNGLLIKLLPEVWGKPEKDALLYLWRIREAIFFLGLEYGEFRASISHQFSINPYSFIRTQSFN